MLGRPVVAAWTKKTLQDHFFKEAKRQGYVSRAAFKLLEVQKKHKVIKQGGKVLDLGCVPGAWLQVACQQLGPRERGGLVLGVDIQEVSVPPKHCDDRVYVLQADARLLTPDVLRQYTADGFDTVLSDMLQFTSGVNDVELSLELAGTALHAATGHYFDAYGDAYGGGGPRHDGVLRPGGALVMKVYEGAGTQEFMRSMAPYFTKVLRLRVEASRSMSREFYAIGLGRKPPPERGDA
ncbi:rlmE [Scenedesmus sp. PABB004]|nr:rlmE [Scenedesmus sp. PABB004]